MIESLFESFALAYIGPGAGLSMIGTLLAVIGVLLLALLAPVLYVVQFLWRLTRKRSVATTKPEQVS